MAGSDSGWPPKNSFSWVTVIGMVLSSFYVAIDEIGSVAKWCPHADRSIVYSGLRNSCKSFPSSVSILKTKKRAWPLKYFWVILWWWCHSAFQKSISCCLLNRKICMHSRAYWPSRRLNRLAIHLSTGRVFRIKKAAGCSSCNYWKYCEQKVWVWWSSMSVKASKCWSSRPNKRCPIRRFLLISRATSPLPQWIDLILLARKNSWRDVVPHLLNPIWNILFWWGAIYGFMT